MPRRLTLFATYALFSPLLFCGIGISGGRVYSLGFRVDLHEKNSRITWRELGHQHYSGFQVTFTRPLSLRKNTTNLLAMRR